MRSSVLRYSSLIMSIAVSGMVAGCFTSSKEVDTVPVPAVVQAPPPQIVQVPAPVVVAPPAPVANQTTSSTSWGNGAVEQKRTTTDVDGSVQNRTTTTWNSGDPSQTTTTTTTNPY